MPVKNARERPLGPAYLGRVEAQNGAPKTGPEVIAASVKSLPTGPGVYRMLDAKGDVIYVGKARNLRARVGSYVRGSHTNRIARMVAATAAVEVVTVRTEAEALLLEANLIKRFRPRFNVSLRDDKSFPYILIARDHVAPPIMKHRGARNRRGDYFGPFASAGAVNRTINMLERAFLLRSCSDSVYESRTRPCLLYQIKRCSAPCTGEISHQDYARLVEEAVRFLKGESQNVREMYQKLMEQAAAEMNYEQAARYRDRLWALAHVTSEQTINLDGAQEADVFGAYQEAGQTCIQVFFFRAGQNWGNRAYYPRADRSFAAEEVLDSFVAQFYDDKPVPRLILLSHEVPSRELLADALAIKTERKVEIRVPRRGVMSDVVEHAVRNAKEALARKLAETSTQRKLLEAIRDRFGLPVPPRRIEVFDNSHIRGANAVGAMVVAGRDGFVKSQYRKFNIKSAELTPGDDYAMMREVLTRRFRRLITERESSRDSAERSEYGEASDDLPEWPDLVLIDGGAGQLAVAHEVLGDLGIKGVALVAMAKGPDREAGREHFYLHGRASPMLLEPRDPVLYFVQRVRDEAHRFAIGTHRAKRRQALSANPLDEIPGIGRARKRALLRHFGSAKAVSRAGVEDLAEVPGISAQMAQAIYDFFHERDA
jgi:excinuclease ABC subunit C